MAWFEEATKQDEPEIQNLFARLLARAATGDEDALDRRLLDIVSRMTPIDAKVFEYVFNQHAKIAQFNGEPARLISLEVNDFDLWQSLKSDIHKNAYSSVEHLVALGVFERTQTINSDSVYNALMSLSSNDRGGIVPTRSSYYELEIVQFIQATSLGQSLFRALHDDHFGGV